MILRHEKNDSPPAEADRRSRHLIHLVGVGGSGMCNLAAYLAAKGFILSGSDMSDSEAARKVRELGARITVGHSEANLPHDADMLVATAAAPPDNPEIAAARSRGIPVLKYAQLIGRIMEGSRGVAVAGTHGKTTTTSMIGYALRRAGMDPTFMIGGEVPQLTAEKGLAGCVGDSDLMIVEACEYDRSFLNMNPDIAVITNIDYDHGDYFTGEEDLVSAFAQFAERLKPGGIMVYNIDDRLTRDAVALRGPGRLFFGKGAGADFRFDPDSFRRAEGFSSFAAFHRDEPLGGFRLRVPGVHNVYNALAAMAVCHELGADMDAVRAALEEFDGARRRCEHLGKINGIEVIDDFAHHPTEIAATLGALRQDYPDRRIICVFQPHQHSRTRMLMDGFAAAFGDADRSIVAEIFACRDSDEDIANVTSAQLVERIRENGADAHYAPSYGDVVETLLNSAEPGDVVVTMGAGPICRAGRAFLDKMIANKEGKSIAIRA